jgi:hypothetical protein
MWKCPKHCAGDCDAPSAAIHESIEQVFDSNRLGPAVEIYPSRLRTELRQAV